eukprot:gene35119-42535_t
MTNRHLFGLIFLLWIGGHAVLAFNSFIGTVVLKQRRYLSSHNDPGQLQASKSTLSTVDVNLNNLYNRATARHKSIPFFYTNNVLPEQLLKETNLPLEELAERIFADWQVGSGKGYYVTGRPTRRIYSEDCFFDGPDVDMPVRGLQKYLLSASQLFHYASSRAELTRPLELLRPHADSGPRIVAYWRIEGALNLPWKPRVKPWTGRTEYIIDAHGLVVRHEEHWDLSLADAAASLLLPGLSFGALPAPRVAADLSVKYVVRE